MSHHQASTPTTTPAAGAPKTPTAADKFLTAIAVANLWRVPESQSWHDADPGLLTTDLIHKGVGHDGAFVVYGMTDDGGAALTAFVSALMAGSYPQYPLTMTVTDFANAFSKTGDPAKWAAAFAQEAGVTTDAKLSDIH